MFDHVDVQAADYAESARFYETVLAPLGLRKLFEDQESACSANFNVVRGRCATANLHLWFTRERRTRSMASTPAGVDAGFAPANWPFS